MTSSAHANTTATPAPTQSAFLDRSAPKTCYCCGGSLSPFVADSDVQVRACASCGSLLIAHVPREEVYNPWAMKSVTPTFQAALRLRREAQAKAIIERFKPVLSLGKVVDYGCGQGAFVRALLAAGIDAAGSDISLVGCEADLPSDRFFPLTEPWGFPSIDNVSTVCLLDVIEHAEAPDALVRKFREHGVRNLVIKVPMLNGPIGYASQLAASVGKTGLLKRLLLTGEISPHFTFFSRLGLIRLGRANGFEFSESLRIPDVGPELPDRLRSESGELELGAKRPILKAMGTALAGAARLWSDTEVFVFRR